MFAMKSFLLSIWQHIKALLMHKITVTAAGCCSPLGRQTQRNHVFKQPMNHTDFEISFQNLVFF